MSGAAGSYQRIGVRIGADSSVECFTYANTTPILDISSGSASVAFSVTVKPSVDLAVVEFARALAGQAALFAAEVERLHAEQAEARDCDNHKAADVNAA